MDKAALSRRLKAKRTHTSNDHKRVRDAKVVKLYKNLRDNRADVGDHTMVTAKEVSEELQDSKGRADQKFISPSRVKQAARNNRRLRDPCCASNGAKARESRRKADMMHHNYLSY